MIKYKYVRENIKKGSGKRIWSVKDARNVSGMNNV